MRVVGMQGEVCAQPDNKKRQSQHKFHACPNFTSLHDMMPFPVIQKKMRHHLAHLFVRHISAKTTGFDFEERARSVIGDRGMGTAMKLFNHAVGGRNVLPPQHNSLLVFQVFVDVEEVNNLFEDMRGKV